MDYFDDTFKVDPTIQKIELAGKKGLSIHGSSCNSIEVGFEKGNSAFIDFEINGEKAVQLEKRRTVIVSGIVKAHSEGNMEAELMYRAV